MHLTTTMLRISSTEHLYLDRNLVDGSIPSEIGMNQALTELQFDWNLLTGSLPQELYLLTS